jgi:inosine/xanthosine triphosphatase
MIPSSKMKKTTRINCGSTNPPKMLAAKKAFERFGFLVSIKGFEVSSGVNSQPIGFAETSRGAKIRAVNAFKKGQCDFSIGLEAGIVKFPGRTGYMDVCVAVIYDGREFFYGTSPMFEYPKFILRKILSEKMEAGEAYGQYLGTGNPGRKGGIIGHLSKGKITRAHYMVPSVEMALVSMTNQELY